jgi:hypothetical protein
VPYLTPHRVRRKVAPGGTFAHRVTFTADTTSTFANPERGYAGFFGWRHNGTTLIDDDYYMLEDDWTLARTFVHLDDFRTSDIPDSWFTAFEAMLQTRFRANGHKAVLYFTYNWATVVDNVFSNHDDTTEAWMLRHIAQLTPYLEANVDVIAIFAHSFIGAWGEMHNSTNGFGRLQDGTLPDYPKRNTILQALLAAVPDKRMVMMRYVDDLRTNHGDPVELDEAFDGSNRSRTGFHNDYFQGSPNDAGTFGSATFGLGFTEAEDRAYIAANSTYTATGGEAEYGASPVTDGATAVTRMLSHHFTYLSGTYNTDMLDAWEGQAFGSDDYKAEIGRRMGYRFELQEAYYNDLVSGGRFSAQAWVINRGFAAPVNRRPVYFVLTQGSTKLRFAAAGDLRFCLPGQSMKLSATGTLPTVSGDYDLHLEMPDEDLDDDPRYSILCANAGVRDADTGLNLIAESL